MVGVNFIEADTWPTHEMETRGNAWGLLTGIAIAIPSGMAVALSILRCDYVTWSRLCADLYFLCSFFFLKYITTNPYMSMDKDLEFLFFVVDVRGAVGVKNTFSCVSCWGNVVP